MPCLRYRLVLLGALLLLGLGLGLGTAPATTEAQSAHHEIRGTVAGPSGEPLEGINVRLWRRSNGYYTGPWTGESTGPDGTFAVEVPQGSYRLELTTRLDGGGECDLGLFGPDGERAPAGAVTHFPVETEDITGIAITLTEPTSELCREVRGAMTDAEGNPLARVWLHFSGHGESQTRITDDSGVFRAYLRDGSYRVTISTDGGSDCTVEGYAGRVPAKGSSFVVDGEGVSGLRFVLSGEPREARRRVSCPYAEVITTELEPGWNLAGWTGPETAVSVVFAGMPQLEAIHAWDVETQSFRAVTRQESGIGGPLDTLQPGMGLWLRIGGTERVNWTRPLLAKGALVSLADGWNLVSWGGRDRATADEIFNSLGAEPVVAATWDASRGQFLLAFKGVPTGASPELRVRQGGALWLHASRKEHWLQPGWPAPDVVLLGDYPTGTEQRYRRSIEGAQAFYAERYGAITSDVTFYFVADRESLEGAYPWVVGRNPSSNHCADSGNHVIFIATYRCLPIAHEYFHSIQQDLSGNTYLGSPIWIVEGSAVYTDFQKRYSEGTPSYEEAYYFVWSSLGVALGNDTASGVRGSTANSIGYLAMEWLADEAGEDAILDYFSNLKPAADWREAFSESFGLPVDDFYSRFEEYRLEVAPSFRWEIQGRVVDRHSQPIEGVRVFASRVTGGTPFSVLSVLTDTDGSFSISDGPGSGYVLMVRAYCESGAYHYIGALGESGFSAAWRTTPHFAGEDRDRKGIVITLPTTLAEFRRDNCGS